GQVDHVAACGEAIEVLGEAPERGQELAADEEDQVRVRALHEHRAHVDERLERAAEAPARVLRGLGDPGDLAVPLGQQGRDDVELAVGPGPQDVCWTGDFDGHGNAKRRYHELDKASNGTYQPSARRTLPAAPENPMADHDDPGRFDAPTPADPDALARRVAALEAELAAAREEARTTQDRWLRERADLENLKKRSAKERQDAVRYGNESLLRDLLPVIDNLERAIGAASGGGNGKSLVEGVDLVRKAFIDTLQRHGVER